MRFCQVALFFVFPLLVAACAQIEASACGDGVDNDGDGFTDAADPGCAGAADDDEFNDPAAPACNDDIDNDSDGLVDFPVDPGCDSAEDASEFNEVEGACADGADNDGDGAVDFPADPGCDSAADDDEADPLPTCGDGFVEGVEECDGVNLGGSLCVDLGFSGGTLACDAACTFDTSGCFSEICGDDIVEGAEECDGANFNGEDCQSLGFAGGFLDCNGACAFDTSSCVNELCGNGVAEGSEQCDGDDLDNFLCTDLGFLGGDLACDGACAFDTSSCLGEICGNGTVEGSEDCDGANLDGEDCESLGFSGGALACDGACAFDTSSCLNEICGNGVIEGAEICDGANLGGESCVTLGFSGGTLACNGSCDGFDTSLCAVAACSDGADLDAAGGFFPPFTDGFIDFPADPGCTSPDDNDEGLFADFCGAVAEPQIDVTFANRQDLILNATTLGEPNNIGPTDFFECTQATGGEVVFFLRLDVPLNNVILTTNRPGTDYDTVLYVRQANCDAAAAQVELCDDDVGAGILASELDLNMPAGDYFIFVDGFSGGGNFELLIDFP